jgi:2-oxoisovalerate dehydrogenase E2 component (dihydrolipoyl transacylase)
MPSNGTISPAQAALPVRSAAHWSVDAMADRPFRLPDIGEGTAEAELVAWHVEIGDLVEEDQPLCDVMTDKATVEVTAPFPGRVIDRTGQAGEMVPVGSIILRFATEDDLEIAEVSREPEPEPSEPSAAMYPSPEPETQPRVLAAPALRKRAADLGIDLVAVAGSGPSRRIRQSDLDAFLAGKASVAAQSPNPLQADARLSMPDEAGAQDVPIIGLRRRIAERLQDAKRRIPHFSYIEEVNVSQLEALRANLNAERSEGRARLTLLPFIIRALARVLPEFPQINALYDDSAGFVRRYRAVHAGIATQTPRGLVVTVLRDVGEYDLRTIAAELERLSELARAGRATPAELSGSTITITSLGAMGGLATTPVINSPEVAIIGVNKMIERPIVNDGRIEVAKVMNLSASFDHRVVDGWDAASFIQRIKELLENPAMLFVH